MPHPLFSHPMVFAEEASTLGYLVVGRASVETTDATVTALREIQGISDDRMVLVHAYVTARRTGGSSGAVNDSAAYQIASAFRKTAGVVTQVGVTSSIAIEEDQGAWDVNWDTTGGRIQLTVKGAANNIVSWRATILAQLT